MGHIVGLLIAHAEICEEAEAGAKGQEEFAGADGAQGEGADGALGGDEEAERGENGGRGANREVLDVAVAPCVEPIAGGAGEYDKKPRPAGAEDGEEERGKEEACGDVRGEMAEVRVQGEGGECAPPLTGHDGAAGGCAAVFPPRGTFDLDGVEDGERPTGQIEGDGGVSGGREFGDGERGGGAFGLEAGQLRGDGGGVAGLDAEGELSLMAEDPVGGFHRGDDERAIVCVGASGVYADDGEGTAIGAGDLREAGHGLGKMRGAKRSR